MAGIVGDVLCGKNRFNRYPVHFCDSAEDGGNTRYFAAMVNHAVVAVFQGFAGGSRSHQDKYIFLFQHRLVIVTEYDLPADDFRFDDVYGLMGVHGYDAGFGQFCSQVSADDFCVVKADDGVHDCLHGVSLR